MKERYLGNFQKSVYFEKNCLQHNREIIYKNIEYDHKFLRFLTKNFDNSIDYHKFGKYFAYLHRRIATDKINNRTILGRKAKQPDKRRPEDGKSERDGATAINKTSRESGRAFQVVAFHVA